MVSIDGVRDKLRVLLVSGEPHAGERTWRNLLKSDASVDLVHFTILRPPEKQDGTPINELSLIAFPTRELFQQKINEFQLIIFDRYARQGVLPIIYFDNIARYVRDGGAVLIAAGPDYASQTSLWRTPLEVVLPAEPSGRTTDGAFRAALTDLGKRHPVTRGLEGSESDPPHWSRWFRLVDSRAAKGTTVMQGPDNKPLLLLSREGEGRVALLLSDHIWLWARGYEGGGPHIDLLRRLSHWLMKQPDLEEEALRMFVRGRDLTVQRQTMADGVSEITLTTPSGKTRTLTLTQAEPGVWRSTIEANELGLWRATDGTLTALANVGPANPREFTEVTSTRQVLAPLATATGGDVGADRGRQRRQPAAHRRDALDRHLPRRRLDRAAHARGERGARHRRAAGVRRADRPAAAGRRARRDLGARRPLTGLPTRRSLVGARRPFLNLTRNPVTRRLSNCGFRGSSDRGVISRATRPLLPSRPSVHQGRSRHDDGDHRKVAVLIDGDNVTSKVIAALLAEVAKVGTASVRRIYGDWSKAHLNGWRECLPNTPFNRSSNSPTPGKNSTDRTLVIDAMDLLYTGRFSGFCIVSSDGDFTRFATGYGSRASASTASWNERHLASSSRRAFSSCLSMISTLPTRTRKSRRPCRLAPRPNQPRFRRTVP